MKNILKKTTALSTALLLCAQIAGAAKVTTTHVTYGITGNVLQTVQMGSEKEDNLGQTTRYDALGKPVSVVTPGPDGSCTTQTFKYNSLGQAIQVTEVRPGGNEGPETLVTRISDYGGLVETTISNAANDFNPTLASKTTTDKYGNSVTETYGTSANNEDWRLISVTANMKYGDSKTWAEEEVMNDDGTLASTNSVDRSDVQSAGEWVSEGQQSYDVYKGTILKYAAIQPKDIGAEDGVVTGNGYVSDGETLYIGMTPEQYDVLQSKYETASAKGEDMSIAIAGTVSKDDDGKFVLHTNEESYATARTAEDAKSAYENTRMAEEAPQWSGDRDDHRRHHRG